MTNNIITKLTYVWFAFPINVQILHIGHKVLDSTKSIPNTSLKAFMDAFAFMKSGRIWLQECLVVFFTCQLLKYPLYLPDLIMTLKKNTWFNHSVYIHTNFRIMWLPHKFVSYCVHSSICIYKTKEEKVKSPAKKKKNW